MSIDDLSSARLYTDFGGIAQLRAKATASAAQADGSETKIEAGKEVARQFEAIFLQTMLKSMRDASQFSENTDSDQTRFYQEMFDKQIAIDLASRGDGIGLADMLEHELNGAHEPVENPAAADGVSEDMNTQLLRAQLQHAASLK